MATEVIHVINPLNEAGTDYTTIRLWEAGQNRDLVSADEIAIAECKGGADNVTTDINISGWTTDSTRYIVIRNHADDPPNGYWDSSRYYINLGATYQFKVSEQYVRLEGIQIYSNRDAATSDVYFGSGEAAFDLRIDKCLFYNESSGTSSKALQIAYGRSNGCVFSITNSVFIGIRNGFYFSNSYGVTTTTYICNNTFLGRNIPFQFYNTNGNTTQYIRNNILERDWGNYNFYPLETSGGANLYVDDDAYNDYNSSEYNYAHVALGSHGRQGQIFDFVDYANRDLRITENDTGAKGYGQKLTSFASLPQYIKDYLKTDIAGNPRGSIWDIGAYQISPAGGNKYQMLI